MNAKMNTKLKLLYIMELLKSKSDEEHPLDTNRIIDYLAERGINCERKSVYSDIAVLKDFGLDILGVRTPENGYALVSRDFEIAELRLLIDAVRAANFITQKKTDSLVEKISTLCSDYQYTALRSQTGFVNRLKRDNEEIYYNIDILSRAIEKSRKVSFTYSRRTVGKNLKPLSEERDFTVSPYALLWSDDHYYLVGNNEKYDNLMHLRVDRIRKVVITQEQSRPFSEVSSYVGTFNSADYSKRLFSMFTGVERNVELLCANELTEQILDRFGEGVPLRASRQEGYFTARIRAAISDGLVSWIMQFGDSIKVINPSELQDAVREKAERIAKQYY